MSNKNRLLKDVSRSFYLSFLALPAKVRPVMSLGYLLCRAADTITDTPDTPAEERKNRIGELKSLFATFPVPPDPLREYFQKNLLGRYADCAAWFNALPRTDQSLVQSVVTAVITGMEMDLSLFGDAEEGAIPRALATERDLETYIHWIGGEPGRFWTNVCLSHWPGLRVINRDQFLQDGIVFGTGLQMVNILRDLPADLRAGRCYIPNELLERHNLTVQDLVEGAKQDVFFTIYNDLIDQSMFRLGRGVSYMKQLPPTALRLRAAAAWPMLIGIETLKRLQNTPAILKTTEPVKIKRKEIYWMMAKSLLVLFSPSYIERQIHREATRS